MGQWNKYVRAVMISLLAVICAGSAPVYAVEMGTITSMSEKVYKEKNIESGVVGNVIAGTVFSVLSTETDETGVVWCRVRTDIGTEGYIPAQNVAPAGAESEGAENADAEDMEADNGQGGSTEDGAAEEEREAGGAAMEGSDMTEAEAVSADDAREQDNTGDSGKRIQIMETINIRSGASTDTEIVGKIRQGETLSYLAETENELGETWYEIEYNGVCGYIRKDTVMETENAGDILSENGENGLSQARQDAGDLEESGSDPYENMQRPEATRAPETDGEPDGAKKTEAVKQTEETESIKETKEEERAENSEKAAAGESGELRENGQTEKTRGRIRIDWIAVVSLAGSLFFAAVIVRIVKRLMKICGRMR